MRKLRRPINTKRMKDYCKKISWLSGFFEIRSAAMGTGKDFDSNGAKTFFAFWTDENSHIDRNRGNEQLMKSR